jgi:hypothetical protein
MTVLISHTESQRLTRLSPGARGAGPARPVASHVLSAGQLALTDVVGRWASRTRSMAPRGAQTDPAGLGAAAGRSD